jgi:hypothetical protein
MKLRHLKIYLKEDDFKIKNPEYFKCTYRLEDLTSDFIFLTSHFFHYTGMERIN